MMVGLHSEVVRGAIETGMNALYGTQSPEAAAMAVAVYAVQEVAGKLGIMPTAAHDMLSRAAHGLLNHYHQARSTVMRRDAAPEEGKETSFLARDTVLAALRRFVGALDGWKADSVAGAAPRPMFVSRKVLNAGSIRRWAKAAGFQTVLADDEMRVVIMATATPVDWMKMGEPTLSGSEENWLIVPDGDPRVVESSC
jgi:hypothetical protein